MYGCELLFQPSTVKKNDGPANYDTIVSYTLTYLLDQSPSWEANRFSASQELPAFYGTWKFITAFTSARHLSLSWALYLLCKKYHYQKERGTFVSVIERFFKLPVIKKLKK